MPVENKKAVIDNVAKKRKMFFAICNGWGFNIENTKNYIKDRTGIKSFATASSKELDSALNYLDKLCIAYAKKQGADFKGGEY